MIFSFLDFQYYIIVSNGALDQSFSTNPSRGPLPVWNQTFSLPIRSCESEIRFELLKYDQYKINGNQKILQIAKFNCLILLESFGEYKMTLKIEEINKDTPISLKSSSNGIELRIKMEFISKIK